MNKTSQNSQPISLDLSRGGAFNYLLRRIERGLERGRESFVISTPDAACHAFPNVCAPIAGLMDHYRNQRSCQFSISEDSPSYLHHVQLTSPRKDPRTGSYLDVVWAFDERNHYEIVSGIVNEIRSSIAVQKGVMSSLELCLNEVVDNTLVHSSPSNPQRARGFLMGQVHRKSRRIAIAVFDAGIGIYRSLLDSHNAPDGPRDAISMAVQKGITDGKGQGRGLWLLDGIIRDNKGSFEISSDGVRYSLRHESDACAHASFSKAKVMKGGTTLVDFQLQIDNQARINAVVPGYEYTDLWLESHEDGVDGKDCRLRIKEESQGTGTRHAGAAMRRLAANAKVDTEGKVVLDFSGVGIVSASYADELVAKLMRELGPERFMRSFRIVGLNEECRRIIDECLRPAASCQLRNTKRGPGIGR